MKPILDQLNTLLKDRGDAVAAWLQTEFKKTPAPFYASVDIRHSGYKLAPVDTNLFPAGFNNLAADGFARAVALAKAYLGTHHPSAKRILIIPENHTRNVGYIDNLHTLQRMIAEAGYLVEIGRIGKNTAPVTLMTSSGAAVISYPTRRDGDRVQNSTGFTPDLLILNNDFSDGPPEMLCGIAQPMLPCPGMGWFKRRKSRHFIAYDAVTRTFCNTFELDPWLISTLSQQCGLVDFRAKVGLECVAINVEKMMEALRMRYDALGIKEAPYVFIKSDSGTYGMGVMTARSGEDVYTMNKKTRHSMDVTKGGAQNTEVIIQEGVPTIDRMADDGSGIVEVSAALTSDVGHLASGSIPTEPVLYLIGGEVAGGVWRSNPERDAYINLNTPAMRFAPMAEDAPHYGALCLIARLAALAAAREDTGEC